MKDLKGVIPMKIGTTLVPIHCNHTFFFTFSTLLKACNSGSFYSNLFKFARLTNLMVLFQMTKLF